MSNRHIALVLAAGCSRRLGRSKQLLTRDGETLVHRTVRLAIESGAERVLVMVGAEPEAVAAAIADLACEVVANPEWQRGLGSSLHAAAAHVDAGDGRVLVIPCDLPCLQTAHLRALAEGAAAAPSGCAATRLGDAIGVPAVVPAPWFDELPDPQADQGFGTRLRALAPGSIYLLESAGLAFDIDTPADVEAAVSCGLLDGGA